MSISTYVKVVQEKDEHLICGVPVHFPGGLNYKKPEYIVIGEVLVDFDPVNSEMLETLDISPVGMITDKYFEVLAWLGNGGYDMTESGTFIFTECW